MFPETKAQLQEAFSSSEPWSQTRIPNGLKVELGSNPSSITMETSSHPTVQYSEAAPEPQELDIVQEEHHSVLEPVPETLRLGQNDRICPILPMDPPWYRSRPKVYVGRTSFVMRLDCLSSIRAERQYLIPAGRMHPFERYTRPAYCQMTTSQAFTAASHSHQGG